MIINQFRPMSQDIDRVNILSNEGDIYLAQVVIHGHGEILENKRGHAKIFHSLSELKDYMKPLHIDQYHLLYRPAYDEMIGESQQFESSQDSMLVGQDHKSHFGYFGM